MAKDPIVKEEEKARERRLLLAIENDDVDELHELIEEEPGLLDRLSKHPFPYTPLHIAADAGKTNVVMEMATLKPSFARKLDPKGYSPMHLALVQGYYETVRTLMAINPNLVRVRGRCGITPLHYIAWKAREDELELLAEFLYTCRSSIKDLTNRCETAVHLAVKNRNFKAFKVLLGWLKRESLEEILDWKDQNGNTVLHIAVSEEKPKIIKLLIGNVKVNAKNYQDKTALQIFQANPSGDQSLAIKFNCRACVARLCLPNLSRSKFLSEEPTTFEKFKSHFGFRDESARNITIAVATLVATATYQAMLTPPGGYWQDTPSDPPVNSIVVAANSSGIAAEKSHIAGESILNGWKLQAFTVFNTMVFLASIIIIWSTAVPLLPRTLTVSLLMLLVGCAYFVTLSIEFPKSDAAAGNFILFIYLSLLLVVLIVPTILAGISYQRRCRIDAPRTRVATPKE